LKSEDDEHNELHDEQNELHEDESDTGIKNNFAQKTQKVCTL